MRKNIIISLLVVMAFGFFLVEMASSQEPINYLAGKIIAFDAGHGGTSLGATYPPNAGISGSVYEKNVNIATIFTLKTMLEDNGAYVVLTRECDETIPRRKDRVEIAKQKCAELYGKECDVLVSVHHNGNVDETHNGTMAIFNNKQDFALATTLHNNLLADLFNNNPAYDEGYDRGGYGMTVYFTPAALTESYYVTNKCEAELFLQGTVLNNEECSVDIYGEATVPNINMAVFTCEANNSILSFEYGVNRVNQEATALYQGLIDYFENSSGGGGGDGDKPDKCSPWPECKK